MKHIVLIGLTFVVLVSGAWAANLICYAPQTHDGVDPLAPIAINVALN
ncbi:MAG: hypothetical protein WC670_16480 [Pseudolabrys sp.]